MEREEELKQKLQELQKQLGKKQQFEQTVSSIRSLLGQSYPSASPSLQKSFFAIICRVSTVLKTRYTSPGFWVAGLELFMEAEQIFSETSEKDYIRSCISGAEEHLHEEQNQPETLGPAQSGRNTGYLFEGHLTVDPEPPQPDWLVLQNLMETVTPVMEAESSQGQGGNISRPESAENSANLLIQELLDRVNNIVPLILDNNPVAPKAPPASKEVIAKLPVITVTNDILTNLGSDAECAICKENLVVGDKMQELPCKHTFHPPCLKPWLDEHNSCPICRHELLTEDHNYESWKERQKEAEEERKGAANAVRGGELMYI